MRYAWMAAVVALASGLAAGQNGQGDVARALDEPANLVIADAPVTEALDQVTAQTGLPVRLSESALAHMPHGEQTRVRLTARNVRLREALTALFDPMALQWRLADGGVVVFPTEPLTRIGRRPTFTEVAILSALEHERLVPGQPVLDQLRRLTGVSDLQLRWLVEPGPPRDAAEARAQAQLPATARQYLDALTANPDWTWYLWGTDLVVLPWDQQIARQLARRVSLRYEQQPLLAVLQDLAGKAQLGLDLEPGVLGRLPEQMRQSFTLLMADSTVQQALEAISGTTGLEFTPGQGTVRVSASPALATEADAGPDRPRMSFIVKMALPVPGMPEETFDVFFRPDDLPPELVEQIEARRLDVLRRIHQQYGLEFEPATQPSP